MVAFLPIKKDRLFIRIFNALVKKKILYFLTLINVMSVLIFTLIVINFHYEASYNQSLRRQNRTRLASDIFEKAGHFLKFMSARLEGVNDLSKAIKILQEKTPLNEKLINSVALLIDGPDRKKITKFGESVIDTVDLDLFNSSSPISLDRQGNITFYKAIECSTQENSRRYLVLKISMLSLKKSLELKVDDYLSFVDLKNYKKVQKNGKEIIILKNLGYLFYDENLPSFWGSFFNKYRYLLLFIPLFSVFFIAISLGIYLVIYLSILRQKKAYILKIEKDFQEGIMENAGLLRKNEKISKELKAIRKKQKIHSHLVNQLLDYKRRKILKINELVRVISCSFSDPTVLSDAEVKKLLREIEDTSKFLLEGALESNNPKRMTLKEVLEDSFCYFEWDTLRGEIRFHKKYDLNSDHEIMTDPFCFQIFMINIMHKLLNRAYEGAVVEFHAYESNGIPCIKISSKDFLTDCDHSSIFEKKNAENELILPGETFDALASDLGITIREEKKKTTTLIFINNKKMLFEGVPNVVQLFK